MPARVAVIHPAMLQPSFFRKSQQNLWRLSLGALGLLKKMIVALWRAA